MTGAMSSGSWPPPIVGGDKCYPLGGLWAVNLALTPCQCGEHRHHVTRLIARNGSTQLRGQCVRCQSVHPSALRQDDAHHSEFPVLRDNTINSLPCEVCGERGGTEEHHWAPRHLFGDDADKWPTSFLCVPCHSYWHRVVTPQMAYSAA